MGREGAYERTELELMTTYQLKEICRQEKIMNGVINPLDKEELVWTILRYRGKRQDYFIREHIAGGEERLQQYLRESRISWKEDPALYCGSQLLLYEGLSVEYYDNYTIPYRKELAGTNAFVIGSDLTICAILNIEEYGEDRERLYMTRSADLGVRETQRKDYRILCAGRRLSECMYNLYYGEPTLLSAHMEVHSIPLIDFIVKKPATLTLPMAIDFGSVNTTAGVYLDSAYFDEAEKTVGNGNYKENAVNYTVFWNGTQESMLLPSVIGVAAVEEEDYKLLFGYEAEKLAVTSYIDEGFCVFYDIKRWIGEYDKEEEIVDRQGRRRFVKRAELLRRFFLYVIHKTENRFKCRISQVHISSPVKQKHHFQKLFLDILPEYRINQEVMLDEGMAVLYHTISNMLEQDAKGNGTLEENKTYEALIIDCGGGTTDLCSYRFRIQDRRAAYKIFLDTTYENGDTDFGGNNLTYRMMQVVKIALVHAMDSGRAADVKEILEYMDTDVYRFVDQHGVKEFYRHLEQEYARAEEILPTRFADFERYNRDQYYKVKNNFYTLFDLAEQIKKRFYGKLGTRKVTVGSEQKNVGQNRVKLDKWKLSFRKGKELSVCGNIPEIQLDYFEINLLLSGEIYGIVLKFMEELYRSGRIQDFSFIKLTGQSCKIDLFKDALKEFVPGRMIQFRKRAGIDAADFELKMTCVDGALKYLRDRKLGLADIHLDNGKAVFPYQITAYTHNGKEVVLMDGSRDWNQSGTISRNMEDLILQLYLKDTAGGEHCSFQYVCRKEDFAHKTYEEIKSIYGDHVPQKETDAIENGDVKFFVWAKQEEWGFQVVSVYCEEDALYLGKAEFFRFENDSWVNSFFDGKK